METIEEVETFTRDAAAGAYKTGYDCGVLVGCKLMHLTGYISAIARQNLDHLLLDKRFSQRNLHLFAHLNSLDLKKIPDAERHIYTRVFFLKYADLAKTIGANLVVKDVTAIHGVKSERLFEKRFYDDFIKEKEEEPDDEHFIGYVLELGKMFEAKGRGLGPLFWPSKHIDHESSYRYLDGRKIESAFDHADSFIINHTQPTDDFFETEIFSTHHEKTSESAFQIERILKLSHPKIKYYLPDNPIEKKRVLALRHRNPSEDMDYISLLEKLSCDHGACFDLIAQPTHKYVTSHSDYEVEGMRRIAKTLFSFKQNQ